MMAAMHEAAYEYVYRFAHDEPVSAIEVGARDVNGNVRELFPKATWYGIDAQDGPNVDEVADGATWQPPEPVDLVVCTEVFEHTPNWSDIVANIKYMLRPGGRAIFTMAGPGRAPHGLHVDDPLQPGHYRNIRPDELERLMTRLGYADVEVEQVGEDVRATGVRP